MKVFIICKEPFPYGMAATQRIICYAKALISESIDCEILVYSRQEKGTVRRNMLPKGVFEHIPFKYSGWSTRKPSRKILRKFIEWNDKKSLRFYLRRNLSEGDIVIAYVNSDTEYLCDIIDLVHQKGAKYVRELNEIPFFGGKSEREKQGLENILNNLFPKCDGFITIADTLTNLAQNHRRKDAAIVKLPILVEFDKLQKPVKINSNVPFIFHAGSLYEQKDGVIGMLSAFSKAARKLEFPVKMILTGSLSESPDRVAIGKTIIEENLQENVEFVGYLNQEEISNYLSECAFAVMNKHDNIQNNHGFSTKLATYLAAGKAVIMTDVGEAMNWLTNGETAWIVPREDTEALAEAIINAFRNPEECTRIGENGRELCRRCFDWRSVSKTLSEFLLNIGG